VSVCEMLIVSCSWRRVSR